MSDEQFDKRLKNHLDTYRPSLPPNAWDQFRRRLPVPWPIRWLTQYGGWALGGLATMGLLGLLSVWYNQKQELNQLHELISTLTISQSHPKNALADPPLKRDTVYIVKRIIIERLSQPYRSLTEPASTLRPDNTLPDPESVGISPTMTQGAVNTAEKLSRTSVAANPADKPVTVPTTKPASPRPSAPVSIKSPTTQPQITTPPIVAATVEAIQPSAAIDNMAQLAVTAPVAMPVHALADSLAASQPKRVASEPAPPILPTQQPERSTPQSQSVKLQPLRPRIGLTTMVSTAGSIGVGPSAEIFLHTNLSVSAGLLASRNELENHDRTQDYNQVTGQEFIEKYSAYLPRQYDRIEDIRILTSMIQLPFNLKYYTPLSKKWSVLFSVGTNLDLSVYQNVNFESYYQGYERHNSFESHAKSSPFHDFMFGTGIQYQHGRVIGQLSPFWQSNFRSTDYSNQRNSFGINLSLWLDFARSAK